MVDQIIMQKEINLIGEKQNEQINIIKEQNEQINIIKEQNEQINIITEQNDQNTAGIMDISEPSSEGSDEFMDRDYTGKQTQAEIKRRLDEFDKRIDDSIFNHNSDDKDTDTNNNSTMTYSKNNDDTLVGGPLGDLINMNQVKHHNIVLQD